LQTAAITTEAIIPEGSQAYLQLLSDTARSRVPPDTPSASRLDSDTNYVHVLSGCNNQAILDNILTEFRGKYTF